MVARKLPLRLLLSPSRYLDHKLFGLLYIATEIATLYGIFCARERFETYAPWYFAMTLAGCCVTSTAIRNFRHLSKTSANPGMFAKGRTFSYPFVVENLWFQVALLLYMAMGHPIWQGRTFSYCFTDFLLYSIPECLLHAFVGFWGGIRQECFPKTSYKTWEQGNEEINAGKLTASELWWINIQVKVVRWNYVIKSRVALDYLRGAMRAGLVPLEWRWVYYFLIFDASHNITAAFFLQTLKFHGYISAAAFSWLFNFTPYCGAAVLMYYFLCAPLTLRHLEILSYHVLQMVLIVVWIYPERATPAIQSFYKLLHVLSVFRTTNWFVALGPLVLSSTIASLFRKPLYTYIWHCIMKKEEFWSSYSLDWKVHDQTLEQKKEDSTGKPEELSPEELALILGNCRNYSMRRESIVSPM